MKPIIEVDHLSKCYRLGHIGATSLRDSVQQWFYSTRNRARAERNQSFWALRDVSFQIPAGEVVGIIGRNGAGKSTLLKILSRITEPTGGRAFLRGRVVSLLEVGTGFHPDLTGRENIFLNGAILGMKREEILRKFDEIVDFAGVGPFLDTPVKRYSSGMYVRLAFAVAAHLEPEILIIDEVLAVGDAAFQQKCLGKMGEVARAGRTVLFVSHNMAAVQTLCTQGIVLENGRVVFAGKADAALGCYLQRGGEDATFWRREDGLNTAGLQFQTARIRLEGSAPYYKLHIDLELSSHDSHRPAFIAIDVLNSLGAPLMQALPTAVPFLTHSHQRHTVRVIVELPPLVPGHYSLTLWTGPQNSDTYDAVERALGFEIEVSPTKGRTFPHTPDHGYIVPPCTFEHLPGEIACEAQPVRNAIV